MEDKKTPPKILTPTPNIPTVEEFTSMLMHGQIAQHAQSASTESEKELSKQVCELWNGLHGIFCSSVNNVPRIWKLARLCWKLIGSRTLALTLFDNQDTGITFMGKMGTRMNNTSSGIVLLPMNWLAMLKQSAIMQQQSMLLNFSLMEDFWSLREEFASKQPGASRQGTIEPLIIQRARAHEAIFIRHYLPDGTPLSAYHQKILREYPEDPRTPDGFPMEFEYQSPAWSLARAREFFQDTTGLGLREPLTPEWE